MGNDGASLELRSYLAWPFRDCRSAFVPQQGSQARRLEQYGEVGRCCRAVLKLKLGMVLLATLTRPSRCKSPKHPGSLDPEFANS
jgi:hypothetical protein